MKINFSIYENKINVLVIDEDQYILENSSYSVNNNSMFEFINYQYAGLLLQGADVFYSSKEGLDNLDFFNELKNNFSKSTFKKTKEFKNSIPHLSSLKFHQNFLNGIKEIQSKKSLLLEIHKDKDFKKNSFTITFFDKEKIKFSDNKIKNSSNNLSSKDTKELILETLNKNNVNIQDIDAAFITSSSENSPKTPVKIALADIFDNNTPIKVVNKVNLKSKKKGAVSFDDYKTFKIKKIFNEHLENLSEEIAKTEHNVLFIDGGASKNISASSFVLSHNGVVFSDSFSYKDNNCYEEIAFLAGLRKVLNSDILSKNKTHVICDGDIIEGTLKQLNGIHVPNANNNKIEKSPLFQEVKELYQNHKEKIYVHYVKSHSNSTNLVYFGNNLVDKMNTKAIRFLQHEAKNTNEIPSVEMEVLSIQKLHKVHSGKDLSQHFNEFAYKSLNMKKINNIKCNYGYEKNTKSFLIISRDEQKNFNITLYDTKTKSFSTKMMSNYSNFPKNVRSAIQNGSVSIVSSHLVWDDFKNSLNLDAKRSVSEATNISINLFHKEQIDNMQNKIKKFEQNSIQKVQREEAFEKHVLNLIKNNDLSKIGQDVEPNITKANIQESKPVVKNEGSNLGIKFDFEKTYGNKELFPKGHQVDKDKTYLIMRFGNKNVEIHRMENGNHDIDVYPQDFNHIEHLNNHLTKKPIDNNKPLVLSLPNSTTQKEIAETFRGQSFTHCHHVYNIVRNIKKENLFLTKTLDFSFQVIEKDVKWYNNVLEKSREIKPERKSRNKLK